MSELTQKIVTEAFNRTPQFAKERVGRVMLSIAERMKTDVLGTEDHEWYLRHAHGWEKMQSDEQVLVPMSVEERMWYLLDSTSNERRAWQKYMTTSIANGRMGGIQAAFNYLQYSEVTRKSEPADRQVTRKLFFLDFLRQERSSNDLVKQEFQRKYEEGTRIFDGPWTIAGKLKV